MASPADNRIILYPEYRCRICLEATKETTALNQTINYKKTEISLNELLEFCVNAQVCVNGKADGLCSACMEKGIVCYEFKKKFEESQSILLKEIEEDNSFSFAIKIEEDLEEEDLVVKTENVVLKEENLDDDVDVLVVPTENEVLNEEISDEEVLTENVGILKVEILDEKVQITENIKCHEDKQVILNTPGDKPTALSSQAKKYHCDICEKTFQSRSSLIRHRVSEQSKTVSEHKCVVCGETFTFRASLFRHKLKHSPLEQENNVEYKCEVCEQTFKLRRSLISHALKAHKKVAVVRKQLPCQTCGRIFFKKNELNAHMMTHSGEKPFPCEFCGRSFSHVSNLGRHKRIHTGERPYSCSECGKSFALHSTLSIHQRIHTGETPYVCKVCGKGFRQRHHFKLHMYTHSPDSN